MTDTRQGLPTDVRPLPLGKVLHHTLHEITTNAAASLFISLPLLLLFFVLTLPTLMLNPAAVFGKNSEILLEFPSSYLLIIPVLFVLMLVISLAQAVNWHRLIILDEPPTFARLFRLDRPVWRYIWAGMKATMVAFGLILLGMFAIMIIATILGINMPMGMAGEARNADPFAWLQMTILAMMALVVIIAGTIMRFFLILPAAAVGNDGMSLGASWHLTRGNNLKFIGIAVLLLIVPFVMGFALNAIFQPLSEKMFYPAALIYLFLNTAIQVASGLFFLSLLSTLYQFFVERKDFA